MTETLTQPKKHLALDMDWASFMGAVFFFLIFLLFSFAKIWVTLHGRITVLSVAWWTPLFAAFLVCLVVRAEDKAVRVGAFVFAVGPLSRIILRLCRASCDTRLVNEIFVRWIEAALYTAICGYVPYWVVSKVRHV